jgi:hypothetical protein
MPSMLPAEYLCRYGDIKVPADPDTGKSPGRVNVHVYRNNGLTGTLGTTKAMADNGPKDAIVGKIMDALKVSQCPSNLTKVATVDNRDIMVSATKVVGVYAGKGSPEDISDILWLARHWDLVDVTQTAAAPKKNLRADATWTLQHYCDDYVGLDCNGFVGNYVGNILGKAGYTGDTDIPHYYDAGTARTKLGDVQAFDVMVWPDFGHITIIDSLGSKNADGSLNCIVAESTAAFGGGTHVGQYVIREHKDEKSKKFTINRGAGADNDVYIVGVK